jgi:hypothetical protein
MYAKSYHKLSCKIYWTGFSFILCKITPRGRFRRQFTSKKTRFSPVELKTRYEIGGGIVLPRMEIVLKTLKT